MTRGFGQRWARIASVRATDDVLMTRRRHLRVDHCHAGWPRLGLALALFWQDGSLALIKLSRSLQQITGNPTLPLFKGPQHDRYMGLSSRVESGALRPRPTGPPSTSAMLSQTATLK